jgi:hypothetical protein
MLVPDAFYRLYADAADDVGEPLNSSDQVIGRAAPGGSQRGV